MKTSIKKLIGLLAVISFLGMPIGYGQLSIPPVDTTIPEKEGEVLPLTIGQSVSLDGFTYMLRVRIEADKKTVDSGNSKHFLDLDIDKLEGEGLKVSVFKLSMAGTEVFEGRRVDSQLFSNLKSMPEFPLMTNIGGKKGLNLVARFDGRDLTIEFETFLEGEGELPGEEEMGESFGETIDSASLSHRDGGIEISLHGDSVNPELMTVVIDGKGLVNIQDQQEINVRTYNFSKSVRFLEWINGKIEYVIDVKLDRGFSLFPGKASEVRIEDIKIRTRREVQRVEKVIR